MPPRIPLFQCLRAPNVAASTSRPFTTTTSTQASKVTQRRKHRDPYAIAQSKAKQAANRSRQEVLKQERAQSLGDPIRGVTTPYLQSFDTATSLESNASPIAKEDSSAQASPAPQTQQDEHLNFYLSKSELDAGLTHSQWLSTPSDSTGPTPEQIARAATSSRVDDTTPEELAASRHKTAATASEALRRIASLEIGSSKDRLRVNKQRCIADFGRHNTDTVLPRLTSTQALPHSQLPKTPRVGPDTGSSEVQIAILTAKIRTLADFLETRGRMDKVNKRNLRLLVHRRQKLLRYLERKERGGPRFSNVVAALGLTEGTWKGEISL